MKDSALITLALSTLANSIAIMCHLRDHRRRRK